MEADVKTLEGGAPAQTSVQATIIMNSPAVFASSAIEVPRCVNGMPRRFTEVSHDPESVPERARNQLGVC
jgi:hypothetical protein